MVYFPQNETNDGVLCKQPYAHVSRLYDRFYSEDGIPPKGKRWIRIPVFGSSVFLLYS